MAFLTAKPLHPPPQPSETADKHDESRASRGVSISASIISILVYGSVFYMFDLSPSSVLGSTRFWFLLSNTLVFIIAADYGSFSSSSSHKEVASYDEYVANSRPPLAVSSAIHHRYLHEADYHSITPPVDKKMIYPARDVVGEEVIKEAVRPSSPMTSNPNFEVVDEVSTVPTQDSVWEAISSKALENEDGPLPVADEEKYDPNVYQADRFGDKKVSKAVIRRTKSDKVAARVVIDETKNVIHRWGSARHEPHIDEELEFDDRDKFEAMTDEELNRRVEEFIQKFNRQIRLERHVNFSTQV